MGLGELARKLSRNKVVRFLLAGAGVVTLDSMDITLHTKSEELLRNPKGISISIDSLGGTAYGDDMFVETQEREPLGVIKEGEVIRGENETKEKWVILVHGIRSDAGSMKDLEKALKEKGYHVVNISYPSTDQYIEEHAGILMKTLVNDITDFRNAEYVDMVTHSLGGLVARYYAEVIKQNQKVKNIVTIGTPHTGSKLAIYIYSFGSEYADLGDISKELKKEWGDKALRQLIPDNDVLKKLNNDGLNPNISYLAIAGTKTTEKTFFGLVIPTKYTLSGGLIEKPNDGVVTVESASYIKNLANFGSDDAVVEVKANHTELTHSNEVIQTVLKFLESGSEGVTQKTRFDLSTPESALETYISSLKVADLQLLRRICLRDIDYIELVNRVGGGDEKNLKGAITKNFGDMEYRVLGKEEEGDYVILTMRITSPSLGLSREDYFTCKRTPVGWKVYDLIKKGGVKPELPSALIKNDDTRKYDSSQAIVGESGELETVFGNFYKALTKGNEREARGYLATNQQGNVRNLILRSVGIPYYTQGKIPENDIYPAIDGVAQEGNNYLGGNVGLDQIISEQRPTLNFDNRGDGRGIYLDQTSKQILKDKYGISTLQVAISSKFMSEAWGGDSYLFDVFLIREGLILKRWKILGVYTRLFNDELVNTNLNGTQVKLPKEVVDYIRAY